MSDDVTADAEQSVDQDAKRVLLGHHLKSIARSQLLLLDELGHVPLSKTGAELLFEIISTHYEVGATCITSNLPFDEWTSVFGCEGLTGALLDCLTHHVHIITCNGDSYRLADAKRRSKHSKTDNAA